MKSKGCIQYIISHRPNVPVTRDRFYKSIDDAYTFANQRFVHVLLHDQQLIPRLRSIRHYFLLSQSSFLTQFLDTAHSELRKPARAASRDKLQSLLEVALNGEEAVGVGAEEVAGFKEDLRVEIASTNLYDWLMKVLSVNGTIGVSGGAEGEGSGVEGLNDDGGEKKDKEKDKDKDKNKLTGTQDLFRAVVARHIFMVFCSDRRITIRLQSQIPSLTCHYQDKHSSLSIYISLSPTPSTH